MDLGPRSRRMYRDLRRKIEDGRLPVGTLLPSQSVLAREYGVAVMTARQALERLQTEGYLRIRAGAGTYVETDQPAGADSPSGLRSMIAAAPLPIIAVDRMGMVTSWNPAAERMFGWTAAEVLNTRPPMIPPKYEGERRAYLQETLQGRLIQDVEVVRPRRDGTELTLSLSTAPLLDAEGNITGAVFTYLDLTERKRVEEALRESQERFQGAFESACIGMGLVDLDGRFLQVNRALCDLVGYTATELLTMSFQDITHPDDLAADLEYVRQMLTGEIRTYQMEKRYICKDGRIVWVLLSVSLVHTATGAPLYFVSQIEDITQRKMVEDPLTGLANRLLLQDRIRDVIAHAQRYGEVVALLLIGLDGIQAVNERLGRAAADELLREVSARLVECARPSDTVARLAGNEFAIVLPDIGSAANAVKVADKVLQTIRGPFRVAGESVELAAGIGISLYPFDGDSLQVLLGAADEAIHRARRQGPNRYALHTVAAQE